MPEFENIFLLLRSEKGFSQEEMAKKLNVSKATIGMWETGKRLPGPEKYEEIADYFNVDMDYLYGRSDIRKKIHYDELGTEYVNTNCVRENPVQYNVYYLDDKTAETAQEIYENDKILFDAYRSSSKDRLMAYAQKLMELQKMENGDD